MGALGSKQVVKEQNVVKPITRLPNANKYRPQNENLVKMLGKIETSINNNNIKNAEQQSDHLRMELAKKMFELEYPEYCPKKGGTKKKSQKQNKSPPKKKKLSK